MPSKLNQKPNGKVYNLIIPIADSIWKWYHEFNLNGLSNSQLEAGLHLDDLTHIARHNRAAIQTFYHEKNEKTSKILQKYYSCKDACERPETHQLKTASRSTFKLCLEASSRKDGLYLIVNCYRKILGQTGTGHF